MENNNKVQEVTVGEAIRIVAANNKMTLGELSKSSGKTAGTLSNMMKRGKPSLKGFKEALNAAGEDLDIVIKNGQVLRIKID